MTEQGTELSVLIPVLNECENLRALIPSLTRVLNGIDQPYELLVVDGGSTDGTPEAATSLGARLIIQQSPGYGGALREGFAAAKGRYILTLDADLSHHPSFILKLWRARNQAEIVVASRYIRGGMAYMPWHRKLLSRILNRFFAAGLGLPVRDLSSGFRLYQARILSGLMVSGRNFDVLEEILVKSYAAGWRIKEVPFTYYPRKAGSSHARIVAFGMDLLRAFGRLWRLRNSIESADYDERAFYSRIPLQRYWQRRRHRLVTSMARLAGRTLDVGCGSSVILQSLNHAVGLDLLEPKLRYMKKYGTPLIRGSVVSLPFKTASFDCVVCSQVIEHIRADDTIFCELTRVLRKDGLLILGTPDYSTIGWRLIEPLYGFFAPGAYKDEHITHYTLASLKDTARRHHLELLKYRYVLRSELIMALRKTS